MTNQTRFEMSADTALLYQELLKLQPGGQITYASMADLLGRPVTGADSHLQSALRAAQRDGDMVIDCVRGLGYRRLKDDEIVTTSAPRTERIRRMIKRDALRLTRVENFDALPEDARREHNARLSVMGAIAAMLKPKAIAEVRAQVTTEPQQLPLARTIDALKRRI